MRHSLTPYVWSDSEAHFVFLGLSACMACYGVGTGSWFLMVPLLLAEQLGVEKIRNASNVTTTIIVCVL